MNILEIIILFVSIFIAFELYKAIKEFIRRIK
jgi:hypothetical protein